MTFICSVNLALYKKQGVIHSEKATEIYFYSKGVFPGMMEYCLGVQTDLVFGL